MTTTDPNEVYMTVGDAMARLGINKRKMAALLKGPDARLHAVSNPLDMREKLIPVREVEALQEEFERLRSQLPAKNRALAA